MSRAIIALTLFLLSLATYAASIETVFIPSVDNSGWKIGYGSDRRGKTIMELIPTEEDISNWSKMLSIQFLENIHDTPKEVMGKLQEKILTLCPAANWNVLTQDSLFITYEWSIEDCNGQPDQNEIARLLKGNEGVHRIAYVRKVPKLEKEERETWLKAFSEAYVEKDLKRVAVTP